MATSNSERKGDWMQTATGAQFWPLDPRPEEVHIEDIAHALSNMCRYAGHCTRFYSVAQHSVYVSRHLPEDLKLWGLLHDASEAYAVDIPRPLKRFIPGYREIEDRIMSAIAARFGLVGDMPKEVIRVDNAILCDEASQLMLPPPSDWCLPEPPLGIVIEVMDPDEAKWTFLNEFYDLTSNRNADGNTLL